MTTPVPDRSRRLLDVLPGWLRAAVAYGVALLVLAAVGYLLLRVLAPVAALVVAVAVAVLLAALLMPLVELLHRIRVPRALAALVAVLALLAVVGVIGTLFGVGFAREVDNLAATIGGGVDRVREWLVRGPLALDQGQLDRLTAQAGERLQDAAPASLRGAATVLEALGLTALAVVLLFFLLKDGPAMGRWMLAGVPDRHRGRARRAGVGGWETLQAYVRGTTVVAAVDAVGIGIGLVILGVPLALPLVLVTFVAAFVPLIGATVAGVLAVLVALATKGPVTALLVLGVVLLVQNIEGNLLEPLIMGRAVRLHPTVILVAVAAGALVAGIGGALLATPVAAVAYQVIRSLRSGDPPQPSGDDG
ncbi:MAG TPA: AI-2E family transporter [Pilimelia sp.]|nr:AI-2E family transporter [Pilimelia sp.]